MRLSLNSRYLYSTALAATVASAYQNQNLFSVTKAEGSDSLVQQPSFLGTGMRKTQSPIIQNTHRKVTLNDMVIITGSKNKQLSKEISNVIGVPLADASISKFADGEVSIQINESIQGKNVFIIQSCVAPVNESIMELLLTVSCAKRAAAGRVVAVIPYFGYKHHRRGSPLNTKLNSRFLSSSAMDFAKMLQELGVNHAITVDLQRPGQGQEACYFSNSVPLETILTHDLLIDYFIQNIPFQEKSIVVISPNSECVRKARNFQLGFQNAFPNTEVKLAVFNGAETGSGPANPDKKVLLGHVNVKGSDVVIVDDMVDTAGTLDVLSRRLQAMGAGNIYVCASHGLFTENSMQLIQNGPVKRVVVTDSLPLPLHASDKVVQVTIAPMLAQVIVGEHFGPFLEEENFQVVD